MFRAIYEILDTDPRFSSNRNLHETLKKMIWQTNQLDGEILAPDKLFITSRAISDRENQIFADILAQGTTVRSLRDSYSQDYRTLQSLLKSLAKDTNRFQSFVLKLLNQVIVLPIEATSFEATIEIFERINDRGRQLTNPDIFKAKMYTNIEGESTRANFIEAWKFLDAQASGIGVSLEKLFAYQMYYARAMDPNDNLRLIGLRKYFLYKSKLLKDPELLEQIEKILNFVGVMRSRRILAGQSWSRDDELKKLFHTISSAPNDWWRYPVVVYYLANSERAGFEIECPRFLRKLLATMSEMYAANWSTLEIHRFIMSLNMRSIASSHPSFGFKIDLPEDIYENLRKSPKLLRTLLMMLAYDDPDQKSLLPIKWELEYIYPKYKNQRTIFSGKILEQIEELGNLTIIDHRTKHTASGNFFPSKKLIYRGISIAMTRKIAEKDNWDLDSIQTRTHDMIEQLKSLWQRWDQEYQGGN